MVDSGSDQDAGDEQTDGQYTSGTNANITVVADEELSKDVVELEVCKVTTILSRVLALLSNFSNSFDTVVYGAGSAGFKYGMGYPS